jgi:hypothetical protein
MILRRLLLTFGLLMIPFNVRCQQAPVQNPQAVALAAQAMAALTGTTQVNDITLNGTATRTAGSDVETGTVVLEALGGPYSRMDLTLSTGTRHEVRNLSSNSAAQGYWIGPDSSSHPFSQHNCVTDAAWFAPVLSVLSQLSNPNLVVSYVGQETKAGVAVQHLHFAIQSSSPDPTGILQGLSAEDVYLNASTLLPVALTFNAHPDNDATTNLAVEIDYGSYQSVSGVLVPFQIQKLINNSVVLNLIVNSAAINQGLTPADFS